MSDAYERVRQLLQLETDLELQLEATRRQLSDLAASSGAAFDRAIGEHNQATLRRLETALRGKAWTTSAG